MKIVKIFGIIASFILTALLIVLEFNMNNAIIILITAIIQIGNLIYLAEKVDNEEIKVLSSIGIISIVTVGIYHIDWNLDYVYMLLLSRSIILVLLALICFILIKNQKANSIVTAIGLPLILISLIFEINVFVAIYVGCISLAMIIFGFVKKEYKPIYVEGVVFLVANLIIQLWEFWGLLPIWVYLLVGGLTLIGIVTAKELKKDEE